MGAVYTTTGLGQATNCSRFRSEHKGLFLIPSSKRLIKFNVRVSMIKLSFLLLCLVSLSVWVYAQSKDPEAALQSMVETERAFSSMSREKGTQPSFLAFIAEDGILFRPKAVKGKQWMLDHPAPASDKRPLLSWEPIHADIAAAGDMGYTFGPWQFRSNINDEKAVAWGHFITVWKKQADGTWKFAVDLGVSHPEEPHVAYVLESTEGPGANHEDV